MFSGVKVSDWEFIESEVAETKLKQAAVDIVVGRIVSACSLVTFSSPRADLNYRLNVSPNNNENALEFRSKLIRQLLLEGECLIVVEGGQLYVADSWSVSDSVFHEKTYSQIQIGALSLNKKFVASEVCHIKYHNVHFKRYLKQLDESYGKLFARAVDTHLRDQQLRVYAKFRGQSAKNEENHDKFKRYLKGLTNQLRNESVVVSPYQDDYDVQEHSQSYLGRSHSEVGLVENMYIRQVALALQVPPLLFSGEFADISQHNVNFSRWCVQPLMQLITTALNKTFFSSVDYVKHGTLSFNMVNVLYSSEFEMAAAVEKMIGSAVWTIDDVLELQGKPRENTALTTQRYLTKNIAPLSTEST